MRLQLRLVSYVQVLRLLLWRILQVVKHFAASQIIGTVESPSICTIIYDTLLYEFLLHSFAYTQCDCYILESASS